MAIISSTLGLAITHVHVYKDSRPILKWDLDENKVMEGKITKKLRKIIEELKKDIEEVSLAVSDELTHPFQTS